MAILLFGCYAWCLRRHGCVFQKKKMAIEKGFSPYLHNWQNSIPSLVAGGLIQESINKRAKQSVSFIRV